MNKFLQQIFIWWKDTTIGTKFFTWKYGNFVGKDQFGNKYYEYYNYKINKLSRWVIYNGYVDPSNIPSGWHGWIHYRTNDHPLNIVFKSYAWEKNHKKNYTGTIHAYTNKKKEIYYDYNVWIPK